MGTHVLKSPREIQDGHEVITLEYIPQRRNVDTLFAEGKPENSEPQGSGTYIPETMSSTGLCVL